LSTATPTRAGAVTVDARLEQEAFRRCSYGLLVVDGNGRVICRNLEAERLLEMSGLTEDELTCCALFGCRRSGSVLAETCLTERAVSRNSPLPEIRVDVSTKAGKRTVWIAAAPLTDDASRVVLQLRPGVLVDRRRRSDQHWRAEPGLRIQTLGATSVISADGSIDGDWLHQRTGQVLQFLIATRSRAVTVEQIGESIWPDADFSIAGSVRYYIHALRRKLEPSRAKRGRSAYILSRAGSYRLDLARVELDADDFERHADTGLALGDSDAASAAEHLGQALRLYTGDFLAELPYAEWAIAERERLRELACAALRTLAGIRSEHEQIDRAAACLERLAAMQPYDEDVHRELMQLDILRGRRSDAVRRYAALRIRMNRAFGQDPTFTPAELTVERH
jgi:DNA-binding SARP family transcriptional activator